MNRPKLEKLIRKADVFIVELERRRDLVVHHNIDQFFYMERIAELRLLMNKVEELNASSDMFDLQCSRCYAEIAKQWVHDVRWLRSYDVPVDRGAAGN